MPREPRIYIEKVLYFITAKSLDDRELFLDSEDYTEYLKSLAELKREFGFKLFSYCLLPKRLFLLIELRNGVSISQIMHQLNSNYTKKYNSRYGKKGHLFQSRFKSILVEKKPFILRLTRFIHLLPQELGIINNVASYPFSSYFTYTYEDHQSHTGMQWPNIIDEIREVLGYFDQANNEKEQVAAYENYIKAGGQEELDTVRKILHRTAFVGSDEFKAMIRQKIEVHVEEKKPKVTRKMSPWFILSGSLVFLFLSATAYFLYSSHSVLQNTLERSADVFGKARIELADRVNTLEGEITRFEATDELDGTAWVIRITPLGNKGLANETTGRAFFADGQVTIKTITGRSFPAFEYTLLENNGRKVWKTAKARANGTQVQIEGLWTGKSVKGLVRERPADGANKDFTFVSIRKLVMNGRNEHAIQ